MTDPTSTDYEVRVAIVEACTVLVDRDLVAGFGHVSARVPATEESFYITPRQPLITATHNDLVRIDGLTVNPEHASPPLEWIMHAAIYRRRPDVAAICRTHPRMTTALAVAGKRVRALHGLGCWLGETVPLLESPLLGSSAEQSERVAASLGSAPGLVLRGNGAITVGSSISEAGVRAVLLEESAELQLLAAVVGSPRFFTADEVEERHAMDKADEVRRAWLAFVKRASAVRHHCT